MGGIWGVLGVLWGVCWGVFGGVLEICLRHFGRFSGGKHKGQIHENNILIMPFNTFILLLCLISLCGYHRFVLLIL